MINIPILGDCLDFMQLLGPQSVHMIFADFPYGVTNAKWDSVIDLEKYWAEKQNTP